VEVTDALTGCVTIDTVLVEELQLTPSIDNLEITDETCFQEGDGQIQWSSISGGTEPYSVFVDNTEIDEIFIDDLDPGIYDFTVIDVNGCRLDTVIEISAAQAISINDLPTLLIEEGGSDSLFIIINVEADEIASIVWDPDTYLSCSTCLNVQVTPLEDILYTITVTDINGCVTTTTVEVEVRESVDIYVPNIFSPDGDGINDNFTLFSPDIAVIQKLAVYNRWGELMYAEENFEAGNPNIGWDGQFKGRPLNPGVYVYFAIVELNDGTIQELNGDVTIVR
jgi:gliding motility-associated-like protein